MEDYFSTGIPEGDRSPYREGVEESVQGRVMASLPQRMEESEAEAECDSVGVES